MLITPQNLNIFFTAVETRFWTAYTAAPLVYQKLATTYPVATEQWVSGWIGMLDKLREWQGSRVVHTPAPQTSFAPVRPRRSRKTSSRRGSSSSGRSTVRPLTKAVAMSILAPSPGR